MTLTRDRAVYFRPIPPPGPYTGSPLSFGDGVGIMFNPHTKFDGTEPVIVALHGHGGSGRVNGVAFLPFGAQLVEYARAGYIVVMPDAGGAEGWSSPMIDTVLQNVIAWATAAKVSDDWVGGLGGKPGPVNGWGYSMGGGVMLAFAKNHPTLIASAVVIAPAVSLDVFMPDYYIDVLYCGAAAFTTKTGGGTQTVPTTPSTVTLTGFVDTSGLAAGPAWVDRIGASDCKPFFYTSKTSTTLVGCQAGSGTVSVGVGNIVAQGLLYTGHEGYNPQYDADHAQYANGVYTVPTRLYHGDSDTTVLPAWIAAFLASANNPIIDEHLIVGATHTNWMDYLRVEEDLAFFATHLN
jgi:pimeloyl-ACP methyl ester carboxylesterase